MYSFHSAGLLITEHVTSTVTSSKTDIKCTVLSIQEKMTITTMVYDIYNCPCKKNSFSPLMPNTVILKM